MKKIKMPKAMEAPQSKDPQVVSEFFIKQSFMYHPTADLAVFRRIIDEIIRERAEFMTLREEKKDEMPESEVQHNDVVQVQ